MSLSAALEETKTAVRDALPPSAFGAIAQSIEDLRASGRAQRAIGVGDFIPLPILDTIGGLPVDLSTVAAGRPVVLVFYRGGWCPYCNTTLRAYAAALARIEATGGTLIAVTPETPGRAFDTAHRNDLRFAVTVDRGNRFAKTLGLAFALPEDLRPVYRNLGIDLAARNGEDSHELPIPATYVVAPTGRVAFAHVDADFTHRADPAEAIAALDAWRPILPGPARPDAGTAPPNSHGDVVVSHDQPEPVFDLHPNAHRIASDDEALAVARTLAADFAAGAAERDRDRRLPAAELDRFSGSGLWGITIPKAYGGAEVSFATLAEVIAIISAADPSIGQIPQNHLAALDVIRVTGSEEQKQLWFARILQGYRLGNAFSEAKGRHVGDFQTRLTPDGAGFRVNGEKFYATGALFAHFHHIGALDAENHMHLAIAARNAPGLTITDDWSSFGQRTTASGSVRVDNVYVGPEAVIPAWRGGEHASSNGCVSQIIQAAVDLGIARGAIADTIRFVREDSRPWIDSGQDHAYEDVFTIRDIGDLEIRLHAAEAMLERAGEAIDRIRDRPSDAELAEATVEVAEAKVLTTEIAILAANKLHELAGTRSTLGRYNLDRHWRNARTHTLHDPVRWKYFHIGNHLLNDTAPPRHAWS